MHTNRSQFIFYSLDFNMRVQLVTWLCDWLLTRAAPADESVWIRSPCPAEKGDIG